MASGKAGCPGHQLIRFLETKEETNSPLGRAGQWI